ncbi:MAG: STAS-like domain-containing protein [Fusobacteriaceae bacterium]
MIVIDIANDFSKEPGARYYRQGKFSGEEFFDTLLKPKYLEAKEKHEKLKIIFDGTVGFASSFLNEAFTRLGNEFNTDDILDNLVLKSSELPYYKEKVKEAIYETKK